MHVDPVQEADWYTVLGLDPLASAEEITLAVERMSRQASALANTAPHRSQQLREVTRAIKRDLLSGADARQHYDMARAGRKTSPLPSSAGGPATQPATASAASFPDPRPARSALNPPGPGLGARFLRFLQTGWTCPACGDGAMPQDRFCKSCGTEIGSAGASVAHTQINACRACGNAMRPEEKFCARCGARRS